ncbi:hypothetical protein BLNAU_8897 [Blattamonas nauphoetae]|uniref:BAR domain-containing protein n=1 Tax=Blattamonas nauphoetae TaxID=2049346 RepID=A0ABQ9XX93_9EUKA|nr:hypothetical protein BLNAU_8897 [Blattamonas nauphoetae]
MSKGADQASWFSQRADGISRQLTTVKKQADEYVTSLRQASAKAQALVASLNGYAETESGPIKNVITDAAAKINELSRLHDSVASSFSESVKPLTQYPVIAKDLKANIDSRAKAVADYQKKEAAAAQEKIKGADTPKARSADDQAKQALETKHQQTTFVKQKMNNFEEERLQTMKKMLLEATNVQMQYFCHGLEILSDLQKEISSMKAEDQLDSIDTYTKGLD